MIARRGRKLPAVLIAGAALLMVMILVAAIAPILWGSKAAALTSDIRLGHSARHLLGTDSLGRDVFYRTLVASRLSMLMALLATALAVAIGLILGAGIVAAGRHARATGGRVIDLLVSYPPIIIALAITAIFSPSRISVVGAIGLAFCPQFARLGNTLAASVSAKDYVTSTRFLGVSRVRLLSRHILPNIAAPILVLASVGFATSTIAISGLSFLGLGVQEPSYDWGSLLAAGLQDLSVNPIEATGPAIAILLTGLGAGLVGDGLARYWEPRLPGISAARAGKRRPRPQPQGTGSPAHDGDNTGRDRTVAEVRDLRVSATGERGGVPLVRGVSLDIGAGEVVGLVGESGSGKSLTAMALARLLPPGLAWSADRLVINGMNLAAPGSPPARLATEVGIVFQDPTSCFNPALRIGTQLTEVLRVHKKVDRKTAASMAVAGLREVRVPAPESRLSQYPHELSGGMRQRAMIAMALLTEPALLIADEPTTALDVTVQADVLRLLHRINTDYGTAILLISHDINVVATLSHRVCVMYGGRVVAEVAVEDLRAGRVQHPYTKALLAAAPDRSAHRVTNPLRPLPGRPPRPGQIGHECSFASRCPLVMAKCRAEAPQLTTHGSGRVACHAVQIPVAVGDEQ